MMAVTNFMSAILKAGPEQYGQRKPASSDREASWLHTIPASRLILSDFIAALVGKRLMTGN